MAVNRRALAASLAAALVITVVGAYFVSRSHDAPDEADDSITIVSNGVFVEPGIPANAPVKGTQLPAVSILDPLGNTISTASLIGQPLIINVWATTCEPCKRELKVFAELQQEYGDSIRFIGVNQFENDATALDFARSRGVAYELMSDRDGNLVTSLGISGLPYTLFVAADGTILAQKGVELDAATLRNTITQTLVTP